MTRTALRKWGNGQGVLIPKSTIDESGLVLGDLLIITVNNEGSIILKPEVHKHKRQKKVTISELFKGYQGDYQPTELDWGLPQGKEIW